MTDPAIIEAAALERERERVLVEELGEQIGYGRLMQLAERIWDWKMPGAAHSVGPCTSMLVPCPHLERDANGHCNWCCGSSRVTRRVLHAIQEQGTALALKKRPVAFRVKDAAGWIIFQDEAAADREAERTGATIQGLYVRDGQP